MDFSELKRFLDSLPEMGIPGVDMTVYQAHRSIFRHSAGFRDREAEAPCGATRRISPIPARSRSRWYARFSCLRRARF